MTFLLGKQSLLGQRTAHTVRARFYDDHDNVGRPIPRASQSCHAIDLAILPRPRQPSATPASVGMLNLARRAVRNAGQLSRCRSRRRFAPDLSAVLAFHHASLHGSKKPALPA